MKPTTDTLDCPLIDAGILIDINGLRQYLEGIPDPRKVRGQRYRLADLLTLLILAKLGGQDQMKGIVEWLKLRVSRLVALLEMSRHSIPHQTTFERVLAKLDAQAMEEAIGQYLAQLQGQGICISIDGKTLRGTISSEQP